MTFLQPNAYALAVLLALLAAPAFAADIQYATQLDPVAFDNSTVKNTVGIGNATATLSGRVLTITGTYSGLSSDATDAHVKMGEMMGIPGPVIGDLKITGGASGQLSGSLNLSAAQLAALKQGGISIVVDSQKASQGNLWGWLHLPQDN